MRVIHLEVGDYDGDGQGDSEDAPEGADRPHEHAQVGLGHHVAIAHRGHGDQGPPQPQGDGVEVIVGVWLDPLGVVDEGGEDDDAENEKENKEHELLGRGTKGLKEDLEAGGVSSELKEPEDPDDGEELKNVGILEVRGEVGEEEVDVEAHRSHTVDNVDGTTDKIEDIWGRIIYGAYC